MKTGKDVILKYCETVKTHDIEHLQNCLDNERDIKKGIITNLAGCPSSYEVDFDGLCFEEEVVGWENQNRQCNECWKQALELEIRCEECGGKGYIEYETGVVHEGHVEIAKEPCTCTLKEMEANEDESVEDSK